ncbi:MAG: hypothetical protein WCF85_08155 [Rhodospirillaceae bacterium]
MSIDAFSQAFTGTDWDKLAAVRPAAKATGVSAGDAAAGTAAAQKAKTAAAAKPKDDSFLTFDDVIDIVNPLQHIPVVDSIYRRVTGDTIRPQGEILGGFLYGGLVGGGLAVASVLFEQATGINPVNDVIAFIAGDDTPAKPQTPATPVTPATPAVALAEAVPAVQPAPSAQPTPSAQPAPVSVPAAAKPSASSVPVPAHASAGNRAREAVTAANRSALQQLAMDMAGGGEAVPAVQAAPASVPPAPASVPVAPASAKPGPPSKMPERGAVTINPEPPPGFYAPARRFSGYTRSNAGDMKTRMPVQPPAGAAPRPPVGASPSPVAAAAPRPLHPPGVILPVSTAGSVRLPAIGEIKPLVDGADAFRPLVAPVGAPAGQVAPAVSGDAVSVLMMRNLEKYQAMSRNQTRRSASVAAGG